MRSKKLPPLDLENIMPLLIGVWRRFRHLSGPPDSLQTREFRQVVESVKSLKAGLEEGDALIGKNYFSDPNLLSAYILYQWVIHYQQGLCLINELPETPRRVLDLASGPAPFAFAALQHGVQEVVAIDQSLEALRLGSEICGRYGYPLTLRQGNIKTPSLITGEWDLIILGHSLLELFPDSLSDYALHQKKFIDVLLSHLSLNGHLLIVDSSLPHANRRLLQLRDALVKEGIPVQAPCVWRGECPALKTANSPCYAQREFEKPYLIKEIQRASNIQLGSLKMSYLIVKHRNAQWPTLPSQERQFYRVISPPFDSYQGKRFYLCGTDGRKKIGSHLRTHPKESKAFEFIRRGELISLENALEKGDAIDIVEGTKLFVDAACNKAVGMKHEKEES